MLIHNSALRGISFDVRTAGLQKGLRDATSARELSSGDEIVERIFDGLDSGAEMKPGCRTQSSLYTAFGMLQGP